jgi:hypothetical protein
MWPPRINLFLLCGRIVDGFRCFSEYEFTWWDGAGTQHINAISMSHFQLKANAALKLKSTNRYPLKEAFFIARLHPTYQETLLNDCPHALITAHLLIAIFKAESDTLSSALEHYRLAMKIFNETARIHQEVTYYAWPFEEVHAQAESAILSRVRNPEVVLRNVSFLFSTQTLPAGVQSILTQYIPQFRQSRLFLSESWRGPYLDDLFNKTSVLHPNSSDCSLHSAMTAISLEVFPVIVISTEQDLNLPLLEHYLKFLLFSSHPTPSLYPLGTRRSMPKLVDSLLIEEGNYASANFAITNQAQLTCGAPVYPKLRCDDGNLPMSLRLCIGNEHTRNDWRDTVLAPVVPRHPVKN